MKQTRRCVRCLKRRATFWIGFIDRGNERLLAGFCRYCDRTEYGFFGHWRREMGVEKSE